jgi:hypothetical protein
MRRNWRMGRDRPGGNTRRSGKMSETQEETKQRERKQHSAKQAKLYTSG